MDEAALPTPEQLTASGGPWFHHLGLVFDEVAPSRVVGHVDIGDRHHQPYGIAHGGVWCTVVETMASMAAGLNVDHRRKAVVGVANSTDFIRPVRTGRVVAVAEPLHLGRLQHLWEVTVTRADDGKLVARGQVRMQVIDSDRELAGTSALDEGTRAWGRQDGEAGEA